MPVANTILRPDSTVVPEIGYSDLMDSTVVYAPIYIARADTYHTDARLFSDSSNVLSDEHRLTVDRTIVSEAPVGPQRRMPRYRIL
jgi:hypothetical protein